MTWRALAVFTLVAYLLWLKLFAIYRYLVPLEKYGLVIPHDLIEEAWNQIWNKGYVHEVAQFFATGWLANYWRIDPMTWV